MFSTDNFFSHQTYNNKKITKNILRAKSMRCVHKKKWKFHCHALPCIAMEMIAIARTVGRMFEHARLIVLMLMERLRVPMTSHSEQRCVVLTSQSLSVSRGCNVCVKPIDIRGASRHTSRSRTGFSRSVCPHTVKLCATCVYSSGSFLLSPPCGTAAATVAALYISSARPSPSNSVEHSISSSPKPSPSLAPLSLPPAALRCSRANRGSPSTIHSFATLESSASASQLIHTYRTVCAQLARYRIMLRVDREATTVRATVPDGTSAPSAPEHLTQERTYTMGKTASKLKSRRSQSQCGRFLPENTQTKICYLNDTRFTYKKLFQFVT